MRETTWDEAIEIAERRRDNITNAKPAAKPCKDYAPHKSTPSKDTAPSAKHSRRETFHTLTIITKENNDV